MSVSQVEHDSENALLFTFTRCRKKKSSTHYKLSARIERV